MKRIVTTIGGGDRPKSTRRKQFLLFPTKYIGTVVDGKVKITSALRRRRRLSVL